MMVFTQSYGEGGSEHVQYRPLKIPPGMGVFCLSYEFYYKFFGFGTRMGIVIFLGGNDWDEVFTRVRAWVEMN